MAPRGNELQMPMDFMFTTVDKLSPAEFRRQIAAVDGAHGWPVFVIGNHDLVRSYNRYGDGKNNDAIAKLMGAFYLTLRGTPIMYYGEESAWRTTTHAQGRRERSDRPHGMAARKRPRRRTHAHAVEQRAQRRISKKDPWLPVPPSYRTHNVAAESKDTNSALNLYKKSSRGCATPTKRYSKAATPLSTKTTPT